MLVISAILELMIEEIRARFVLRAFIAQQAQLCQLDVLLSRTGEVLVQQIFHFVVRVQLDITV